MPVYRRISPDDTVDSTTVVTPSYDLVSGTFVGSPTGTGWRGGPTGVGSAVSLYGGSRSKRYTDNDSDGLPDFPHVFKTIRYSPTTGEGSPYGLPTKSSPITASVHVAFMRNVEKSVLDVTPENWGNEHWDVIEGLYGYYSRFNADYRTASYDHYCPYFNRASQNIIISYPQVLTSVPTGSFTIEAWIKPFLTQSSTDLTIVSSNNYYRFGITGSDGRLFFSSSVGRFTSSFGPDERRWSHVAVRSNLSSGTFTVNMLDAGTFQLSGGLTAIADAALYYSCRTIGSMWSGTLQAVGSGTSEHMDGVGTLSFHGFISDVRVWNTERTAVQMSASHLTRVSSSADGLVRYYELNDGPLNGRYTGSALLGSQSLELVTSGSSPAYYGALRMFNDRAGPVWHPNDNQLFVVPKRDARIDQAVDKMIVIHVPSAFYGRQIATGSVSLTCNTYSSASHGLVRTLVDDGRGGLYLSGSACSSSIAARESYAGVGWNKVGNVFYSEGLIVIKDPSMLDFGSVGGAPQNVKDLLQLSFCGNYTIPTKTIMCRVEPGTANATVNTTAVDRVDGRFLNRHQSGSVFVTSIGLYDSRRRLVGVAKVAQPIERIQRERLTFRLRIDF